MCFVINPIQKIAACFPKKVFLLYKLYNYHYIHQQKPPRHKFTLAQGLVTCAQAVGRGHKS